MMEPTKQFEGNYDPTLTNTGVTGSLGPTFRNPVPSTSTANVAPVLPPRPDLTLQSSYGINNNYAMNSYGGMGGMGGMGSYGMGGYGSYGMGGMGSYGMGGYGSYGMGAMGGMGYGGYNRFGPMDMESRFIQLAEENSRPAFESIQGFVNAVGSVAMMLENTFFALTSSFRAILGVAENFGRLRSLFAQFWSTFAVVRSLNWLIRKLMVLIGIRSESEFKAWAEAVAATQSGVASPEQRARGSSWPVLLFFGVVAAAPYIVLRMMQGLSSRIHERLNEPATWQQPLSAVAQYDYQASSPQELSFSANQVLTLAPQHLQGHLWNTGWLMATTDRQHAGLIPVPYVKVIRPSAAEVKAETENGTSLPEVKAENEFEKHFENGM